MVSPKRGTAAWLFTTAVLVAFVSSFAFAQDGDRNESGYTSKYLANTNLAKLKSTPDNARAREEAMKERFGTARRDPKPFFSEAQKQRNLYKNLLPGGSAPAGTPAWQSLGPTKTNHIQNGISLNMVNSGRMRTILPNPFSPDVVYLLTSSGGLWKTTNFTKTFPTWSATTDSQFTTSGGAAAFGRNQAPGHETIYVGMGDPFDGTGWAGGIMLKTTDGGATWADPIFLPTASTIRDVKVDTSGAQDTIFVATDFGLYVSNDGGASYNFHFDGTFGTGQEWSIAKSSQGWLVSVEDYIDGSGSVMLTTDLGNTWTQVGTGLTNTGRMTLGVGAPGDSIVYSFSADPFDNVQRGLFKSTDGGQTFTSLLLNSKTPLNPNHDQPGMNIMRDQAFYNQMILVDPTDATRNTVYIGGQLSSAKTSDGGNTWRIISNWLAQFGLPYVHADFHAAAFYTGATKTVFFGSDGGLFTSTDGGASFTDTKNVGVVSIIPYSLISNPQQSKSNIMGLQDNGTFSSQGAAWNQTIGGDGFGVGWSQANGNHALGSVYFEDIQHANGAPLNQQRKWTDVSATINTCYGTFFTAIATPNANVDPSGNVFYTYTSRQIYKSTDGGQTWFDIGHVPHLVLNSNEPDPNIQCTLQIAPPVTDTTPGLSPTRRFRAVTHGIGISPVPPDPNDPTADGKNTIAVSGSAGWVVTSHDGGNTWHETYLGGAFDGVVPSWAGFTSSVEWADNSTLYVASENAGFGGHLAKSTDGGVTFTDISGAPFTADNGLPQVPIDRVKVDPRNKNVVYVGTFLGLYRSTDAGATFSRFGAGLPMVEVSDIYMPPNGSFIRISTYGRGVWELDNP